jgi:hypothetical protein
MGLAKRELEEQEALREIATGILMETGAVEQCPIHDDVILDQGDDEAIRHAYALATARIKAGQIDADRADLMAAIKGVVEDSADECYSCAKIMDED